MKFYPWRFAVALATVFFFALTLGVAEPASAQTVRKSVTQLTPAELLSLRTGVAKMMSYNSAGRTTAKFRRSWVYWANMHGHFGDTCRGAIVGNGLEGLQEWSASNKIETDTWCKCEHGTQQFLTWHRMYIYYFEKVLQQSANDPTLTLPYWDEAADPKLPAAFRDATYVDENGKTQPNPLRVAARRPAMNAGTAKLAAATTSTTNAMAATNYATFSTRLEATPHGAVHCAIADGGCPNGLMGAVPVAAMDPVFYFHHANIDRLYECWLKVDEAARLPTSSAILDQRYSFIDSNGSVKQRQVRDMLTTAQLGYTYEGGSGCPAPAPAATVASSAAAATKSAQAAQATITAEAQTAPMTMAMASTELKRGTTEVPVAISTAATTSPAGRSSAAAAASNRSAVVTIKGVNAAIVPGVLYEVFLENAAGKRQSIGVINFFGFGGPATGGKHDHAAASGRDFEFDATDAVKKLGITVSQAAKLAFVPTTGLSDSTAAKATAAIPAKAKVTFKSALLTM